MPSHHLPRRDSWPPTIVHLPSSTSTSASIPDMDENPFSYFLEPDDPDPDFPLDLSAGIETDDPHRRPTKVREISPSSLQRLSQPRDNERDRELARLEHDMHAWLAAPTSPRDHPPMRSHGSLAPPPPPARGRGAQRLAPSGARGRTRSLSAQRPHSWREPSPEIARIEEVDEDAGGREREPTPGLSEAGTEGEEMEGRRKVKKRVRWALPDEN